MQSWSYNINLEPESQPFLNGWKWWFPTISQVKDWFIIPLKQPFMSMDVSGYQEYTFNMRRAMVPAAPPISLLSNPHRSSWSWWQGWSSPNAWHRWKLVDPTQDLEPQPPPRAPALGALHDLYFVESSKTLAFPPQNKAKKFQAKQGAKNRGLDLF